MIRAKLIVGLACVLSAAAVFAQPPGGPPRGDGDRESAGPVDRDDEGPPRSRDGRQGPPPCPLMQALDTNHDHVLSAEEIANAPAALKKLDKNGDGKLSEDELRPAGPPERERRGPAERGRRRSGPDRARPDGPDEGGPGGAGGDRGGPPDDDRAGPRGFGRGRGDGPDGPGRRVARGPSAQRLVEHAMHFDADGDGKLSRDELLKFAKDFARHARGGRGGPGGPGGPGGGPGGPGGQGGPGGPPSDDDAPNRPPRPE